MSYRLRNLKRNEDALLNRERQLTVMLADVQQKLDMVRSKIVALEQDEADRHRTRGVWTSDSLAVRCQAMSQDGEQCWNTGRVETPDGRMLCRLHARIEDERDTLAASQ